MTSCLSLCSWTTVLPEGLEECESEELRHVPLSLGLCLQRQRGPTAAGVVEAQLRWRRPASTQPWLAPARFPPCTDGQAARDRDRVDPTQRFSGLETCPLILRLAPEVRAQDARGECEVTPRYLRLGCCHPVSRPSGDKARFPDESGSASQPWCQSNLPTRLETNLPPVPPSASTREEEVEEVCKVQVFERRETPFPAF